MRAWQIIVASAATASIATAALFLPVAMQSQTATLSLLQTHWPGAVIVWLSVYSVATLIMNTAVAVRDLSHARGDQARLEWPRRYLFQLGVTHYFSAILVMLALGLLPLTVITEPFFSIPAAISTLLALVACALGILVGVLGWLTVTAVAAFATPSVRIGPADRPDSRMLQEIIELLRARPAAAATELVEQLRQRDRATLEAIKELAAAVNRLRNGVSEIQHDLQHRGSEQAGQSGSTSRADIMDAASELRAATAALTAAITKLDEIASGLAAFSAIGAPPSERGNLSSGSRSQLSSELQELLRDMTASSGSRSESPR
jgi:hypothetical protein